MDLNKGQIIKGEVIDFTHEGNGLIKIDDFVVFLDGGIIKDKVEVEITKVKKNFALGKITKIIEKSEDRSDISSIEKDTGLPLIEYDYKKQLEYKKKKVESDLNKFAGLDINVEDTIGMDNPYEYRNHVQIPVVRYADKTYIGFFKQSSKSVLDIDETILLNSYGNEVFKIVKEYILENNLGYGKKENKGYIRHIGIRINKLNEIMLILVTNKDKLPLKDELIEKLKDSNVISIYQNINSSKSSLVYGRKYIKIYGNDYIEDYIGDFKYNISPKSFFQVNSRQTEVLYNKAIEYLEPEKEDIIYDLYCGIGTISMFAAKKAKKVIGIEVVKEAIDDANKNKELNNIDNIEFLTGETEKVLPELVEKSSIGNKVILDPPRAGCEEDLLKTILQLNPERIVYVSCNPSTLARDINILQEKYRVKNVQPVDMFPHTAHIETVAILVKK